MKGLVAGIGNNLLHDDGLGPQAIAQLRAQYEFCDEVELLDRGTPTLDFVDYLRGRDILILIDALARAGGRAAYLRQEQLKDSLANMRLGAHQPCLHETLHTSETARIELKEALLVVVVGNSFDAGTDLGPYVSRYMPEALEPVVEFIRRHA